MLFQQPCHSCTARGPGSHATAELRMGLGAYHQHPGGLVAMPQLYNTGTLVAYMSHTVELNLIFMTWRNVT